MKLTSVLELDKISSQQQQVGALLPKRNHLSDTYYRALLQPAAR